MGCRSFTTTWSFTMHRRDGYAAIAYLTVLVAATFCLGILIADEDNAVPMVDQMRFVQAR
jgi:hypothetical protein